VRRRFEVLECVETEFVVQSLGIATADSRDRRQDVHRIGLAAQSIQHRQPSAGHELTDGARDPLADRWELFEPLEAATAIDVAHRFGPLPYPFRGSKVRIDTVPVSALIAQQTRSLLEAIGDLTVRWIGHAASALI
jgi:hypothetical protein